MPMPQPGSVRTSIHGMKIQTPQKMSSPSLGMLPLPIPFGGERRPSAPNIGEQPKMLEQRRPSLPLGGKRLPGVPESGKCTSRSSWIHHFLIDVSSDLQLPDFPSARNVIHSTSLNHLGELHQRRSFLKLQDQSHLLSLANPSFHHLCLRFPLGRAYRLAPNQP
jgi:hypothetical protein